ncbi:DUF5131 family protein [Sphingobium yanoikuyae]|uniref:DUF5131 family protein n=1 Tax=Sphingobium yanoikuyae TaxID=13690 RepID=UPI0035C7A3B6
MSDIEWTGKTWNPIAGCRKVSPGCDNCYAILEAHRKNSSDPRKRVVEKYRGTTCMTDNGLDWTGRFNFDEAALAIPSRIKEPTVWFVNSMSDLFGEDVTDNQIAAIFKVMNDTPQHTYQILTKRANRAAKLASSLKWTPNIWLGVSVETDKYLNRVKLLKKVPAAIRFLSCEPLLGPLTNLDLGGIHWVIVGGESGRSRDKVRPMHPDWARDIRDKCAAANVPFFFKQWGNWDAYGQWHRSKKGPGHLLDGLEHRAMPVAEPRRWNSKEEFRYEIQGRGVQANEVVTVGDTKARIALRDAILRFLDDGRPRPAPEIRAVTLPRSGLDSSDVYHVNLNAWALVDLLREGRITTILLDVPGKRGRTKRVKHYQIVLPTAEDVPPAPQSTAANDTNEWTYVDLYAA